MIDFPLYSPIEKVNYQAFSAHGVDVFVKRDDMIHPYISGNKWRKLKYNLIRAASEGKRHLVTFGGPWSNHLVATACASARFGFKSTGFVRGEQVSNLALSLCRMFGMELIFTSRQDYLEKERMFERNFAGEPNAFFIGEGGSGPEAVKGCAELVNELDQHYDHLFCACGTGTTAAGIMNGLAAAGCNTRFHAVPVLKEGGRMKDDISHYLHQPFSAELHTGYHFGGYAKVQPELVRFITGFSSATGILIEPVYTGKLFFAVANLVEKGYFKPGERILVIHTGGLTGLAGQAHHFA